MARPFTVGLLQYTAEREHAPTIATALRMAEAARARGAELIVTPENSTMIEPINAEAVRKAVPAASHPGLAAFADFARRHAVWFLAGSLNIKLPDGRIANRQYLIDPSGRAVSEYSKIHLFDVDLPNGERYRESERIAPGDRAVTHDLPWCRLGHSICYDLRFPQLYRALAQAGAELLAIPSAFTVPTGEAHWHVLIRARAIENGAYVIAAAQWGTHAEGRRTYGHSLVVDPWGRAIAEGGESETIVVARIDPAEAAKARAAIPALGHDRPFTGPAAVRQAAE